MTGERDYVALADALLADVEHDPGERARRIAGIYACFYLDDPLIHSWAGIAAFVSLQLHRFLDNADYAPFAQGNRDVYASIVPNLLRFRDGVAVEAHLAIPFARLAAADVVARNALDAAFDLVARGVDELSVIEQRDVVQASYAAIRTPVALLFSRVHVFRLGWDTASPVLRFRGHDVRDAGARLAWMRADILPTWEKARREQAEWLRADVERVRRFSGVRVDDLPPRWPGGVPP
ncbi:MAG: DUF2515 family protein [Myxococcota bacterium]